MKIKKVTEEVIVFDNGTVISYDHCRDCCEDNYADFKQIESEALDYDFETELKFEAVEETGFRFGDSRRMFFIPCYSEQNGYYSSDIDIYYKGEEVLSFEAEMRC